MDLAWLVADFSGGLVTDFASPLSPKAGFSGAFLIQRLLKKSKRQSMQKINSVNSLRVAPFTLA